MSDLPIDWDDPRIKDYLSLTRLQVLTPLSLLINASSVTYSSSPTYGLLRSLLLVSVQWL